MARKLPELGQAKVAELEAAWREHTAAWAWQRPMVLKLVAQHELSDEQIAVAVGVGRSTVFRYLEKCVDGAWWACCTATTKAGWSRRFRAKTRWRSSRNCSSGSFAGRRTPRRGSKSEPGRSWPWQCLYAAGKSRRGLKSAAQEHGKKDAAEAEAFKTQ